MEDTTSAMANSVSLFDDLSESDAVKNDDSIFERSETLSQNGEENLVKDLIPVVDEPKKHLNAFETFITYRITTNTSRTELEQSEYIVRRRYSDFYWLRQQLTSTYPTHIVPPLPEKHGMREQMDRYDRDFIESRMQMLNQFVARLADHPVLSCDQTFVGFLTASQTDFNAMRKAGPGILDRLSDSLQSMASSYMSKERTFEFEKMNEYITKLADKIQVMEKIGSRIFKQRKGYVEEMQHLQPCLAEWANSEPDLSDALKAVAEAFGSCANSEKLMLDNYKSTVGVPLHEYGLYVSAAKEAMNRRDSAQMDYEVQMDQLCRLKTEQNQVENKPLDEQPPMFGLNMWRSPEEVQQLRLQQLSTSIASVSQQVEASRDKMECANENLRADYERWNQVKAQDLKSILIAMADQHIRLYEECLAAWTDALPIVKGENE